MGLAPTRSPRARTSGATRSARCWRSRARPARACSSSSARRTRAPRDLQELALADGGPLWERAAAFVADLGEAGATGLTDVGAVVGATAPEHLARARALMPGAFLLLPGVGAQGGRVEDLAPAFAEHRAGGLVTASRSIVHADAGGGGAPATRRQGRGGAPARGGLGARVGRAGAYPPVLPMASRRSPARWLAPIAVLACAFAVYAVVHKGLEGSTSSTTSSKPATKATADDGKPTRKKHRRRYVVKSGDTLSAISAKTGVPLATIQRLNPDLDAQSLHAGEKVKLRP